MPIDLHPKDDRRESWARGLGIFQGRSVVLLVGGAGAFVRLFRILAPCDVDWPFDIGTSVSPLFAIVG